MNPFLLTPPLRISDPPAPVSYISHHWSGMGKEFASEQAVAGLIWVP
ncbi:MAG: hypothetical protein WCP06_08050 [Verrucomicrobiota bacterium]